VAALGDCGQPQSTGSAPTATDALAVLKGAVGLASSCDAMPCICDVNGDGNVTSPDALRVLQAAVGQPVAFNCDCGSGECVTLGDVPAQASLDAPSAPLDVPVNQVLIEAKIVGLDTTSFDELGIGFDLDMSSPITTDAGPAPGGVNGDGRTLAVDSNASGGPPDLQYLLYGMHRADGALPILNKNFVSPFMAVKSFFLLPTDGCVLFAETAVSEPQNFPGTMPVENLPPIDPGLGGGELLYFALGANDAAALSAAIQSDSRNAVLSAPSVIAYSGQSILHMADDVEPTLEQVDMDFRTNIQNVTQSPFGLFSGPVLDVTPTILGGDAVMLDIRPASQAVSFYFSTAFQVDGSPVDAEIPVLRRSRNVSSLTVMSGQTVVIGGLLRDGATMADKGLPLLGDIPVLGMLFSHKHFDAEKQNLVIFITATLVTTN
jgi:type II secretory pathway component GspD/PulD (secretin)